MRATKSREGRTSVLFNTTTETEGGGALTGAAGSEQPAKITDAKAASNVHWACFNENRDETLSIYIPWLISVLGF
ncbi:hypothetical protein [Marinobacter sp.]|uniref:hypothetical protein n=1 Tax=Marinobacter sp. TaxID=50741 RepID=UPI003A900EE8